MKAYEVEVPTIPTLVTPEKSHMIGLTGWLKIEGDQIIFISDEDERRWIVQQPRRAEGPRRAPR